MPNLPGPITDLYHQHLDASRRCADAVFVGAEKLDRIFIEATHRVFTEQVNLAQAIAQARDPQGLASIHAEYFLRRPDSGVNYQREIIEAFTEMQSEFGQSLQEYMEQFGAAVASGASSAVQEVRESSQDGAVESAANPMGGMMSMWESAFKEFASMANRNMELARSRFEEVAARAADATEDIVQEAEGETAEVGEEGARAARASHSASKKSSRTSSSRRR